MLYAAWYKSFLENVFRSSKKKKQKILKINNHTTSYKAALSFRQCIIIY